MWKCFATYLLLLLVYCKIAFLASGGSSPPSEMFWVAFAEGFSHVCSSPEGDLVTINVCLQCGHWLLELAAPGHCWERWVLRGLRTALAVGYQARVGGAE